MGGGGGTEGVLGGGGGTDGVLGGGGGTDGRLHGVGAPLGVVGGGTEGRLTLSAGAAEAGVGVAVSGGAAIFSAGGDAGRGATFSAAWKPKAPDLFGDIRLGRGEEKEILGDGGCAFSFLPMPKKPMTASHGLPCCCCCCSELLASVFAADDDDGERGSETCIIGGTESTEPPPLFGLAARPRGGHSQAHRLHAHQTWGWCGSYSLM